MADFLTKKNDVFCHSCFMTIDLTQIQFKKKPKWFKTLESFMGKRQFFRVVCPHCQEQDNYYYSEVKPLSDLGKKLEELNKENEKPSPQFRDWNKGN